MRPVMGWQVPAAGSGAAARSGRWEPNGHISGTYVGVVKRALNAALQSRVHEDRQVKCANRVQPNANVTNGGSGCGVVVIV